MGKLGWLIAFIYVACTALRLARFNTQVNAEKRYFQGLPCPSAAAVMATTFWLGSEFHLTPDFWVVSWNVLVTLLMAFLMVSRVRYYSFKELDVRGKVPFVAILAIVALFVAIAIDPPEMLFFSFTVYALSGPLLTLLQLRKRRQTRRRQEAQGQQVDVKKPHS